MERFTRLIEIEILAQHDANADEIAKHAVNRAVMDAKVLSSRLVEPEVKSKPKTKEKK